MEYEIPAIGTIYKKNCQVRRVVNVLHKNKGAPDIVFTIPGKDQEIGQWYPLWTDWVQEATVIE